MLGRTRRVHFVGIGGAGMSGIAELLANLGYEVSGSDLRRSEVTARLHSSFGVTVHEGHSAGNIGEADVVVVSSAVRPANPEVVEAGRRGIPVVPRAEMLAELMRMRFSVAVAGAHGKTTTTSMIAFVLERGGLDPDAVIGGRLRAFGSGARLGRGEYMVAEADESDRSFLMLWPTVAVMTNIDNEHMESYGSLADLQQAFADFANKVPFYGAVIACADDRHLAPVLPHVRRRLLTYGLDAAAPDPRGRGARPTMHLFGDAVELGAFGGRCVVHRRVGGGTERLGRLELSVPGRHNLQNALAAMAVAGELGLDFAQAAAALGAFEGAERRFERHGEVGGILVVDDYAHHPTEIAAVLSAARTSLGRRLVVVFQPHRYSRTERLMHEFGPSLREADEVVLTDIYAAGEDPRPGVTIEALTEAVGRGSGRPVRLVHRLDDIVSELLKVVRRGDAVVTLGAGSIGAVPKRLVEALRQREARG
ncbi:MAG: UDP-N-acetylmuramate--L-alanine ligase [Acidobacteria bacterium RIFCSPLOWO2_02_FULL_68_18]|nr:MAG: UDP-N-acetylmuramate--L-alanine ligase [Acidobacteria bacterium RIFCSPLOWO2_02_FULL_68_18]OFW48500.1 MAG: UDP-N-acetylmuramate--L-alanine ligase [Acidobacteria bacterium RIFCSPLOWO2_12_FULL_68_19]